MDFGFLSFLREHWVRIRHTNLIERTFGETNRRTKVSAGYPASAAVCRWPGRCWTAPRAVGGGVIMTPAGVRLLQELRRQLHHPSRLEEVADQPVRPAA